MGQFPGRISYAQALDIVHAVAEKCRLEVERVSLAQADGRILAQDLLAPIPLPSFENSAMDGFAVRHADLSARGTSLQLVGEQFAGTPWHGTVHGGQCLRITTGAPIPAGTDTVVAKEAVTEHDGVVQIAEVPALGAFVRSSGADVQQGEVVATDGQLLTPARLGLAAALGISQLAVYRRPTIAVLTSGDELIEPGMPLAAGQIYDSNRHLLLAQLRGLGYAPTAWPILADDPAQIRTTLQDAAAAFDLVIACGGVSAGEKDHLPALLAELGQIHFWKVRMRPGMPVIMAQIGRCAVLGLPGNPVSVLATLTALGLPLLAGMQGRREPSQQWHAVLAADWHKQHERLEFLRGRMRCDEQGRLCVQPHIADASHLLRGAADSNVLIVLPEGVRRFAAGEVVPVIPYSLS
jgi:molybdopterin molybdotransferase